MLSPQSAYPPGRGVMDLALTCTDAHMIQTESYLRGSKVLTAWAYLRIPKSQLTKRTHIYGKFMSKKSMKCLQNQPARILRYCHQSAVLPTATALIEV